MVYDFCEIGPVVSLISIFAQLTHLKQNVFRFNTNVKFVFGDFFQVLHEAGKILCERFDGSFVNVISKCDQSAQKLLHLIVTEFPSFRDVAHFKVGSHTAESTFTSQ